MLATYQHKGKMMVQVFFDSVCQCLGAPAHYPHHPHKPDASTFDSSHLEEFTTASPENKRRASRALELRKNQEWDGLFDDTKSTSQQHKTSSSHKSSTPKTRKSSNSKTPPPRTTPSRRSSTSNVVMKKDDSSTLDSQAVAEAKLIASQNKKHTPPKQRRSSSKKKDASRGKSPDTIFRLKNVEPPKPPRPSLSATNGLHKFFDPNVATALCFATPIRDEEEEEEDAHSVVTDDASRNTLNTAGEDDTIMFEVKYGSNKKKRRPPMMLYPQFKVEEEKDELRRIVESESHKSIE